MKSIEVTKNQNNLFLFDFAIMILYKKANGCIKENPHHKGHSLIHKDHPIGEG